MCFWHVCSSVFLVLQDGEGVPVDVQVKDNGKGTYSCSYTPRKPVKHTAMISWGGVNIPNSPFRVSSVPPEPSLMRASFLSCPLCGGR